MQQQDQDESKDAIESPTRRKMLQTAAKRLGAAAVGTTVGYSLIHSRTPAAADTLRPPGALPEDEFTAACVRCGLCVKACPYDILKLASWDDPVPAGTPFFTAREDPCRMCPDIPCVDACPTGALDPLLSDIRKADMGLAVLVDHETCLNYKGMVCAICVKVCPIRDEAITLKLARGENGMALQIPVVDSTKCTGCGTCEKYCVLSEAAIKVLPRKLGQGRLGASAVGRQMS